MLLAVALVAFAAAGHAAQARLVDRVVAVVDDTPILLSDVERRIALGMIEPGPDESAEDLRRRALEELIEQRLRFQEVDRFGFGTVPVEEIEAQVALIESRFADAEALDRRLAELGLDRRALEQLVARQLQIFAYVDESLGARIFVSLEDIQRFYEEELLPALPEGEEPPELAAVREEIRGILRQRRLNDELERWTEELRLEADVFNYFDRRRDELPPVVETLGGESEP